MMNKPNVLILFTDQQRYDTICSLGYGHMITPNLDRLADEGCTYTRAYSTNPVCMPARHDLLTGLPARAHGYYANSFDPIRDYSLPTLPRIFSEAGYRTAAIGKMHFFPDRAHHGYGELQLMEEIPACRQNDQYAMYLQEQGLGHIQNLHGVRPHIYHIPQTSQMEEQHHGSAWVADRTIEWLKKNQNHPFLLFSSWIHPHPPWDIPKEYQDVYKHRKIPAEIPVSRNRLDEAGREDWFGDYDSLMERRKIKEAYYASITMVDKHIGRILNYMEEAGIIDHTLIIFTSDHGEMLYDKGYFSKTLPYDSSVRIPMIVRYPKRFEKSSSKDEFADLFDVLPTCLDVCGLTYNGEKHKLVGESLCSKNPARNRESQLSSCGIGDKRWVMSRDCRYKYIYNYNGGYEELYDMDTDPGERVNLMEQKFYPAGIYHVLKQRAIEYEKNWGPEGGVNDGEFITLKEKAFHPSARGKFPFFANHQMQKYDDRSNEERGIALLREMEHAVSNKEFSVQKLDEVFNDQEWKDDFTRCWKNYGTGDEFFTKLFK